MGDIRSSSVLARPLRGTDILGGADSDPNVTGANALRSSVASELLAAILVNAGNVTITHNESAGTVSFSVPTIPDTSSLISLSDVATWARANNPSGTVPQNRLSASVIRTLLGLTETEAQDLVVGASLSGSTLTLTQNNGDEITIMLPTSPGGSNDGVLNSVTLTTALMLTFGLSMGNDISVDLASLGVHAQNAGTDLSGRVRTLNFTGDGVTASVDSNGVVTVDIPGNTEAVGSYLRYAALKAINTFVAGDFNAAGLSANSNTQNITVPAIPGNRYLAFAIPTDQPDLTDIRERGGAFSSFSFFEKVVTDNGHDYTVLLGGATHKVYRSTDALLANPNSQVWTLTP